MILALVCIIVAPPPPHTPPIMPPPKYLSTNNHQQQTQRAMELCCNPSTRLLVVTVDLEPIAILALHAGSVSDPDQILFDPWDIDASTTKYCLVKVQTPPLQGTHVSILGDQEAKDLFAKFLPLPRPHFLHDHRNNDYKFVYLHVATEAFSWDHPSSAALGPPFAYFISCQSIKTLYDENACMYEANGVKLPSDSGHLKGRLVLGAELGKLRTSRGTQHTEHEGRPLFEV
ncbi:hypothetical protein F5878DRAFT_728280 [Lentinula raphanica]|uniref:Uncharacterized protein n=1 Tax=Lentinula raphanica TaxID=153919 RepID=A0AA38P107_9AGAR|nr:hypothetical protein F5878DRAFT_728280 [Lentinula raphanica]